ncbi:hypothetical protein KJA15_03165 [Patescibacteria group bacterium]|nr:hypothetical protein [Patescibacteria group bacterium]
MNKEFWKMIKKIKKIDLLNYLTSWISGGRIFSITTTKKELAGRFSSKKRRD